MSHRSIRSAAHLGASLSLSLLLLAGCGGQTPPPDQTAPPARGGEQAPAGQAPGAAPSQGAPVTTD